MGSARSTAQFGPGAVGVGWDLASDEVVEVISKELGITQSAVSQHLEVLRERGFATVRAEGTRRIDAIDTRPLAEVDAWLERFRRLWAPPLEALATEIARGKRMRKKLGRTEE